MVAKWLYDETKGKRCQTEAKSGNLYQGFRPLKTVKKNLDNFYIK